MTYLSLPLQGGSFVLLEWRSIRNTPWRGEAVFFPIRNRCLMAGGVGTPSLSVRVHVDFSLEWKVLETFNHSGGGFGSMAARGYSPATLEGETLNFLVGSNFSFGRVASSTVLVGIPVDKHVFSGISIYVPERYVLPRGMATQPLKWCSGGLQPLPTEVSQHEDPQWPIGVA